MQASCGSRGRLILIKMLVLLFVHKKKKGKIGYSI